MIELKEKSNKRYEKISVDAELLKHRYWDDIRDSYIQVLEGAKNILS